MASQSPRPDAVHITPRGFATLDKETAEKLKVFAEQRGWGVNLEHTDSGWYRVTICSEVLGIDAMRFAKEFGKKYRIEVWFWTAKLYDPNDDPPSQPLVTGSGVVVGAET